jgi:hypothetical protein
MSMLAQTKDLLQKEGAFTGEQNPYICKMLLKQLVFLPLTHE